MFYVIDLSKGFVTHESNSRPECERYIRNAQAMFNSGPFALANGALQRNEILKRIKIRRFR